MTLTAHAHVKSAPLPIAFLLAVAALVLSGCNANQGVNLSSQTACGVVAPDCNPYNPISYAQNNTGIGR